MPDVLAGVAEIDTSITLMGRKSALPLMLSPTALQRVFHWQGERAVARAAAEAEAGAVVLLAPAAASFDQYPNFEKRGEDFTARVKALLGA